MDKIGDEGYECRFPKEPAKDDKNKNENKNTGKPPDAEH